MNISRYARQEIFAGIGPEGQEKIKKGRVAVLGLSGLGTITSEILVRAGVGFIRIVDGEYIEMVELQRHNIFTEQDALNETPKAVSAERYLKQLNSDTVIESIISDINSSNIDSLIEDVDVVIDAADSMETRLLVNEACRALKKPWIYGGALASSGMTVNFMPGPDDPCLKCFLGEDVYEDGEQPTCATVGVLMSTISTIASQQAGEALKILVGSDSIRKDIFMFDLWENSFDLMPIEKDPDCPVCAGKYEFYGKAREAQIEAMCGKDSVQIIPQVERNIDFAQYASKLEKQGKVRYNEYTLNFDDGKIEIKLFKNGRAIIKHTTDEKRAKAAYSEYIGI